VVPLGGTRTPYWNAARARPSLFGACRFPPPAPHALRQGPDLAKAINEVSRRLVPGLPTCRVAPLGTRPVTIDPATFSAGHVFAALWAATARQVVHPGAISPPSPTADAADRLHPLACSRGASPCVYSR